MEWQSVVAFVSQLDGLIDIKIGDSLLANVLSKK